MVALLVLFTLLVCSCVSIATFPIKQHSFIYLLLSLEQLNFWKTLSQRRRVRSHGQNHGTLIKNVASIAAHDRHVLQELQRKDFFSLSLFFFSPLSTFPSIFHLPFYRWASPWPVSRAGSVPARSCVKVWMNVLTWSCECAKQMEKGGTGRGAARFGWCAQSHLLHCLFYFMSLLCSRLYANVLFGKQMI